MNLIFDLQVLVVQFQLQPPRSFPPKILFYFEYVCLEFLWLRECTQVPRQKAGKQKKMEVEKVASKVRELVKHFLLNCTDRPLNRFPNVYLPLSTPEISFA